MSRAAIETEYVDALGKRRRVPRGTVQKILRAMRARDGKSGGRHRTRIPPPIIVRQGQQIKLGPGQIRLEDGTTRLVDRRLPTGIPPGYHHFERNNDRACLLIVAPAACYRPERYRAWGWAIQLYAARSSRSWGMGDLAD